MNRIHTLLAAMTLEEKIGQLNMVAAGRAVTGPVLASGVIEGIRAGKGASSNCRDNAPWRALLWICARADDGATHRVRIVIGWSRLRT